MKNWVGKGLVVLGFVLFISSARGIAADLGQVNFARQSTSAHVSASSRQPENSEEASIANSTVRSPDDRSRSISPVFLIAANGDVVDLLSTTDEQATAPVEPESRPDTNFLPGASFTATERLPEIEPERVPGDPTRIVIPAIHLDAPVVLSPFRTVTLAGKDFEQWSAPDEFAAGWQEGSARIGEIGNTVLIGHHNVHGEVFRYLVDLQPGDQIQVYAGGQRFTYVITNKMVLPEKYQNIDVRMDNARWIMPSSDERLTLITCWPYETNTHRLIIVALPQTEQ